jgi:hypothetical protein
MHRSIPAVPIPRPGHLQPFAAFPNPGGGAILNGRFLSVGGKACRQQVTQLLERTLMFHVKALS